MTGWHVYDHYADESAWEESRNQLRNDENIQPYRATTPKKFGSPYTTIESIWKTNNGGMPSTLGNEPKSHIWSSTDESGKPMMVFAGYYDNADTLVDYMIYPAASDGLRTFSFDLNSIYVNTHTLKDSGFLLNAGIDENGNLVGYALHFIWSSNKNATMYLQKLPSANAKTYSLANFRGGTASKGVGGTITSVNLGKEDISLGTGKANLKVELSKDSVLVQMAQYDSQGKLGEYKDMMVDSGQKTGKKALTPTGFNGFGPICGYVSGTVEGHTCSGLGSFVYSNLEMAYDSSAFDALKLTQYYQKADYKYFINLVGESGNPDVPGYGDQGYADGINRMNTNEIFYISNGNDG